MKSIPEKVVRASVDLGHEEQYLWAATSRSGIHVPSASRRARETAWIAKKTVPKGEASVNWYTMSSKAVHRE